MEYTQLTPIHFLKKQIRSSHIYLKSVRKLSGYLVLYKTHSFRLMEIIPIRYKNDQKASYYTLSGIIIKLKLKLKDIIP